MPLKHLAYYCLHLRLEHGAERTDFKWWWCCCSNFLSRTQDSPASCTLHRDRRCDARNNRLTQCSIDCHAALSVVRVVECLRILAPVHAARSPSTSPPLWWWQQRRRYRFKHSCFSIEKTFGRGPFTQTQRFCVSSEIFGLVWLSRRQIQTRERERKP